MEVRRVVTGFTEDGKSTVKWDSRIEGQEGRHGFERVDLWATDSLPPRQTEEDPATWDLGTSLANGSVLRVCRYHPGVEGRWHSTESIDYAIMLSGELWMQLEEKEVRLKPGDIVIQRGTNHNWVNRGTEPCVIAFILLSVEGGETTGW